MMVIPIPMMMMMMMMMVTTILLPRVVLVQSCEQALRLSLLEIRLIEITSPVT